MPQCEPGWGSNRLLITLEEERLKLTVGRRAGIQIRREEHHLPRALVCSFGGGTRVAHRYD